MTQCLAATALSCALATAQADDIGPYAQLSAGRTTFDFDCGFYSCGAARGNSVKIGGGYSFGIFALEVWGTDWGRGAVYDLYGDDTVRLRSLENVRRVEGTFGLGLSSDVAPKVALEFGWDLTTSSGSSRIQSALAQSTTLGLRLRF